MKRLFFPSLILILCLLAGCTATSSALLPSPGASAEESLEALKVFHETYPDDIRGSYNYAYALTASGNYEEALEVVSPLAEAERPSLRFAQLEAYIYKSMYMYRTYAEKLLAILSFDSANINARLSLAKYYELTGRRKEAYDTALSVLEYDISNAEAISILAKYSDFYKALKGDEKSEAAKTRKDRNPLTPPYIYTDMDMKLFLSDISE